MAASRRLKPLPTDTSTGVDISDLLGHARKVVVEIRRYDDINDPNSPYMILGHLPLTYDPAKVNSRVIQQGEDALARSVCRLVSDWDLRLRGEAIPVGSEHVNEVAERVPTLILNSVVVGILEDSAQNPRIGTPS